MKIRVRFAPSPTGPLHIGGLRTALFNYLYARKKNGVFVLRIEDTDQKRYIKKSEEYINKTLLWSGMIPDEGPKSGGEYGPYRQSERKHIYKSEIQELIKKGKAYYAFDSNESLKSERSKAESRGETFKYGSQNRHLFMNSLTLSKEKVNELKKQKTYVIRLKIEPRRIVKIKDKIRGDIEINSDTLDDKILMKVDGTPTYHFANVVDDHLMKITTVIRGEEWLPSLPLHVLIYEAFEWNSPTFMHLPLILKTKGKGKLSKRDSAKDGFPIFPLTWEKENIGFKEKGFLSNGLMNYLALLGWSSGSEKEIFNLKELERKFNSDKIQKGGARFDYVKARWINHNHIQLLSTKQILNFEKDKTKKLIEKYSIRKTEKIIDLIKERLFLMVDIEKETTLFIDDPLIKKEVLGLLDMKHSILILLKIEELLESEKTINHFKSIIFDWSKKESIKIGLLMQTLRIALVGKLTGPDIFSIINIIGKDVALRRIKKLIENLKK
jgi:glutamyl-tRNA synthetase